MKLELKISSPTSEDNFVEGLYLALCHDVHKDNTIFVQDVIQYTKPINDVNCNASCQEKGMSSSRQQQDWSQRRSFKQFGDWKQQPQAAIATTIPYYYSESI